MMELRGDFIGGEWMIPTGDRLGTINPHTGEKVVVSRWSAGRIDKACDAASEAIQVWQALSFDERWDVLVKFRTAIQANADELAVAITTEMGKVAREAKSEVGVVVARFEGVRKQIVADLKESRSETSPAERLRYHPHGVVGIIGPYNFPIHLIHAHVVPALLLGNTVVIKPSEITPLAAEIYAKAAAEAGFPPGVFNLVQGKGAAGARLCANKSVRGLAFTGSWATGHRILQSTLNRPELLVALEMGGKNTAIVLEDADIRQAAHDIVIGGYLSTGQRCTCTDRILVHASKFEALTKALVPMVSSLSFGDPNDASSFAGPLATARAADAYEGAIARGESRGAKPLVSHDRKGNSAFVTASLPELPDDRRDIKGYTDVELFGPNLSIERIESLEDAIDRLNASNYGLANSVHTKTLADFETIYQRAHGGVWHLNRTTNQASGALPFGGVGCSGNYRPAGSFAPRNMVYPVAVQERGAGHVEPSPFLIETLVPTDLDALEAQHAAEERDDAKRLEKGALRPLRVQAPAFGDLPESRAYLERLYAGDRVVREKKPGIFDHSRSFGAWMVSVDDKPLSTLDAMSQTATVPAGFNPDALVSAYLDGAWGTSSLVAHDTAVLHCRGELHEAEKAFADVLRAQVPGFKEVTFTNSGAEANEKALALTRVAFEAAKASDGSSTSGEAPTERPGVLAFEGSFHGRTLLALHNTYNPVKRGPFEIEGYETTFAPFPVWNTPDPTNEPQEPVAYREALAEAKFHTAAALIPEGDALWQSELASLRAVSEAVQNNAIYAVVVEPMQSEGGDRYATGRFHRALRLLTRKLGVALILDEVQCGFGLGGPFAWHQHFNYVDANGKPDAPDALIFAKRAQVGIVMSNIPDPEETSSHVASLIRGRMHAETVDPDAAVALEADLRIRLADIAQRYPQWVANPRGRGYAFAFDLPDPAALGAYIKQRWWRGAVVFAAGSKTVRYRLSTAWGAHELDLLFESIRRTLSWLDAHPGESAPGWLDRDLGFVGKTPKGTTTKSDTTKSNIRLRRAAKSEVAAIMPRVVEIEALVYEPERRDPYEKLAKAFGERGVAIVAEVLPAPAATPTPDEDTASDKSADSAPNAASATAAPTEENWVVIGSALGFPLEEVEPLDGVKHDSQNGKSNTLYSAAITLLPEYAGMGLGTQLKQAQIDAARAAGYAFITGRNRVGEADHMTHLNRKLGAHSLGVYDNQYGGDAQALYYRIPVGGLVPMPQEKATEDFAQLEVGQGLSQPLRTPPASLLALNEAGLLAGPTINKFTICNYISKPVVRAVEWVTALTPKHPHMYFASSRAETFDKALRVLRYHRTGAGVAIGFVGGYLGHTTAASRSLSDPSVVAQAPGHFDWPRVPHPASAGPDATIAALDAAVEAAGGPDKVLGCFFEVVQERTGFVVPEAFWAKLADFRKRTGVPVVLNETTTAAYRSGLGAFASNSLAFTPDMITWWGGGQTAFVHLQSKWFIKKPLTMVSTWDGDELSLIRVHHQLRALRSLDLSKAILAMDGVVAAATERKMACRGLGLYRVFEVGTHGEEFATLMNRAGVRARPLPSGGCALAPFIDTAERDLLALAAALSEEI